MSKEQVTHVQIRDPAQIPRRRRHHRRRRGRHAAGVACADRDLEVPVDLADQGHFPRIRRRLRQEGQRHVGRPPQARRARRRRRGAGASRCRTRCSPACSMPATACAPTGTASTRPIRCSARRRRWAGTAHGCSAWFYYGGGEALYNELVNDILKLNLVGFLYFPMPTQPLGWFKKPVTSAPTTSRT